jgi:hypothetical protein
MMRSGAAPELLVLGQRHRLAGMYIALEIYSPATLSLRRIEAIGESLADCARMLKSRGLNPVDFEYTRLAT